jgi:2,3-bisphosphoglycerate-dependent phosphoglycerate mutase
MRIFIFARHGQSTLNVARVVNGDPHRFAPLTARGERQARRLADQLRNVELDVAFCTRFPRTRQTAQIVLSGRTVPLNVEQAFDDIDVGALDGATIGEYRDWKRRHLQSDAFPGGESSDDARRRHARALRSLLDRPEQRFLVIGHEVGIRNMLEVLDGCGWRRVPNAVPYLFDENAIRTAAQRLEAIGRLVRAS